MRNTQCRKKRGEFCSPDVGQICAGRKPVAEGAFFPGRNGDDAGSDMVTSEHMQKSTGENGFIIRMGHDKKHPAMFVNVQIREFICSNHGVLFWSDNLQEVAI